MILKSLLFTLTAKVVSALPDVFFIKPIFVKMELFCFVCACGHQIDVGGRVAGSNASDSKEVYAEGIRIPPLKLIEAGKRNETLFSIIEKNVRLPVNLFGDFRAHLTGLQTGENGIYELIQKYNSTDLKKYFKELLDHAERITRNAITKIPDGRLEISLPNSLSLAILFSSAFIFSTNSSPSP